EEFSQAKSDLHNNPELFSGIAYVHWRQGRFQEAQENFRRSVELDPLTALHHYSLAECYNFTRDYENALKAIDRAIILQPDRASYYSNKITILLNWHGDLDEARAVVEEATAYVEPIEIISQGYWQYNLVDISLDSLKSHYQSNMRSNLSDSEYYATMAMTYMSASKSDLMEAYCDSARQVLEENIKIAPDEYGLRMGMGLAQACLGNYDRAIEEGKLAKELMSVSSCHW
ncbi:MAG: tetratricopeptide repeat protein, partial [candidate division Zixibacteria bacterium]|nr:tetratricopeptide repeat protein [candidate division Zixibacteria bacterium]